MASSSSPACNHSLLFHHRSLLYHPAPHSCPAQALAAEELSNAALALSHYQSQIDADEVDLDLMEMLLMYICEVQHMRYIEAVQHKAVQQPDSSSIGKSTAASQVMRKHRAPGLH